MSAASAGDREPWTEAPQIDQTAFSCGSLRGIVLLYRYVFRRISNEVPEIFASNGNHESSKIGEF
jgi:hypothetical protein